MVKTAIAVVLLACACSGAAEPPRVVRDPSKTSALGVFMKTHINPAFSKISFLLFHGDEGGAEVDPDELPTSADALAQAAERLGTWSDLPGESHQSRQVFGEYAAALKNDARNLAATLRGGRPEDAVKAFESLRRKCDSCHHFFRYEEPTSEKSPRPGAAR